MGFKEIGVLPAPEGCTPVPICIVEGPKPTIADISREIGVDPEILKKLYNLQMIEYYSWLREIGCKINMEIAGNCLEAVGLYDDETVTVHYGNFDYTEGDIVLFQDLSGYLMVKEFVQWVFNKDIAKLRTRYIDKSKDFIVFTFNRYMYGKVIMK